jgi:predicted LPLAT superfamily acyltransferase
MRAHTRSQDWMESGERGSIPLMRFMARLALRLGRRPARSLLVPICLYFVAFSDKSRSASRRYLSRVLGRDPGLTDVFRHYFTFASCVLDRVFLLHDRLELFEIDVHGEEIVLDLLRGGSGCFLFGAHFGSFEVVRAMGRRHRALDISMVMYEENARKIGSVLRAINPDIALDIVALGRPNSLIEVEDRLARGHVVGVLADRGLNGERQTRRTFLGSAAAFPEGPFRMSTILNCPVVLMFGVYRGGRKYDVYFEPLWNPPAGATGAGAAGCTAVLDRYVERLEQHCLAAPYNWFNFYDFWG